MVADDEVRGRPEVPVTDRILVPFKAEGGGVEELSWGQHDLWLVMRRRGTWIPLGSVVPLRAGATLDQVTARLRFMMTRYPTLRTRLRLDPDRTRQVVADDGEVPLDVGDAPPGAEPTEAAHRLCQQYMDRDYDHETDWPIRMAVLRHRGVLTHQTLVLCHLALDGTGAVLLIRDLAGWDPVTGETAGPPPSMPPLEQVRRQRRPAARRQSEAAMRHWESILRAAPHRRFGGLGVDRRPRYWKGSLRTPATGLAVGPISARTRTDSSTVLLALYAATLARLTGTSPVPVQVLVSNRFRPGLSDTVSPVFQTGICAIDVAGLTVDEAVTEARRHTLATYKHAYYDPIQRDELVTRVERERGEALELGCFFNDRRISAPRDTDGPEPAGPGITAPQLRTARARSSFEWIMKEDTEFTEPVYLFVDSDDDVVLTISADTRCLSPERMEALVREIEATAVAAALDPATPIGVPGSR